MTPGVQISAPWNMGVVTIDGVQSAAEHVLRLVAMLGLLALLLSAMDHKAIITGFYSLLGPVSVFFVVDRKRIAARLLLVLDYVSSAQYDWHIFIRPSALEPKRSSFALPAVTCGITDVVLGLTIISATAFLWVA
jgi:hypothetical protein